MTAQSNATVVLAHGAWADGSSWAKVITMLAASSVKAVAAPLPLTSLHDDVAALDRTLERVDGAVVLAGHAYAGGGDRGDAQRQGEGARRTWPRLPRTRARRSRTCSIAAPRPEAPKLAPDAHGLIYLPEAAFGAAFAQECFAADELAVLAAVQRPISPACISCPGRDGRCGRTGPSWFLRRRAGPHDRSRTTSGRASAARTCARDGFAYTFDHIAEIIDRFTETIGLQALRDLCLRLWCAGRLSIGNGTARADHRDHFAERQRIRRRAQRRVGLVANLLGESVTGEP